MASIDIEAVLEALRPALELATPNPAAGLFFAQVEHLSPQLGTRVVDEVCMKFPAASWELEDSRLRRWPDEVARRAIDHVRGIPKGWVRIHSLCALAEHLSAADRDEALDGILDGTLQSGGWVYSKPESFSSLEHYLLDLMPAERREEWIAAKVEQSNFPLATEISARSRLGHWIKSRVPELLDFAMRDWTDGSSPPFEIEALWPELSEEQHQRVLERLATMPLERSWRILSVAGRLADKEYFQVMSPPSTLTRNSLGPVARYLHNAPAALISTWLEAFLEADVVFPVTQMLPHLVGNDRTRAEAALRSATLRGDDAHAWALVHDEDLPDLLWGLRVDPYGYPRDELIANIAESRSESVAEKCLTRLLAGLQELADDHRLEVITAMTPWLAKTTQSRLPAAIASLPIRPSGKPEDRQYQLKRIPR